MLDTIKAEKLKEKLRKIPTRVLRDTFQRTLGDGNKIVGALKNLFRVYQNLLKNGYSQWKSYVKDCRSQKLLDALKSEKLKSCLFRMTLRTLKTSQDKVIGMGNAVIGAIKRMFMGCEKLQKVGFRKWTKYVEDCKHKNIMNNAISAKLKNSLRDIIKRTLKITLSHITHDGANVKKVLSNIINVIRQRPRVAINQWKIHIIYCKTQVILDNLKSYRLKVALYHIPARTLRGAYERILGDGDRVKGAIKQIVSNLMNRPRFSIAKWKEFVANCHKKGLFDNARSYRMKNILIALQSRSLRSYLEVVLGQGNLVLGAIKKICSTFKNKPKVALRHWVKYAENIRQNALFDNLRSEKLKNSLIKLPSRTLRTLFERVIGDGDIIKGAIRRVLIAFKTITRNAFDNWNRYRLACSKKQFYDNVRSQKLKIVFQKIPRRVIKDCCARVLGGGDKIKGAIKSIISRIIKMPKVALYKWKNYIVACNSKTLFDGIRSHKLNICLTRIPRRVIKDVSQRILGEGNKIKGAIKSIFEASKKRPKYAFVKWNKYIQEFKEKKFLDAMKTQKLKFSMTSLVKRTMRNTYLRMSGEGSKAKGALKEICRGIIKRTKFAFEDWKTYVTDCKTKNLSNAIISQKLKFNLTNILKRTIRTSFEIEIGAGNRTSGALKRIFMAIEKKSKLAFIDWKNFSTSVKNKTMMNSIRSQKLKISLSSIPRKTLNNIFTRLTKASGITQRALRRLGLIFTKGPEIAITNWKRYIEKEKIITVKNEFESKFKALKIKSSLEKPARKVLRSAKLHADHDNTRLKLVLKTLDTRVTKRSHDVIRLWHVNSTAKKIKEEALIEKNTVLSENRGLYLKSVLNHICRKTTRSALVRMIPKDDRTIKGIGGLTNIKITNRTLRHAFKAIIGESKIKHYLKKICDNYIKMQADALKALVHRVEKIKTVKKINSACFVSRGLLTYSRKVKALRFNYWKNMEGLRKRRIMTKTTGKMMCLMSINFEGAFWKWKYITTSTGKVINPKHAIVTKRICKVGSNYQKRLVQFSFFKLILYFKGLSFGQKLTLPQALAKILKPGQDQEAPQSPDRSLESRPYSSISEIKPAENPSVVSTFAAGNLSREEINSMNQMGALEILSLTFKEIRLRKLAWALSAAFTYSKQVGYYDSERSRFIEQITELRYEKHSLLDDNTTLRHHNDSLISSLEKANDEFQTLSLHLDHLRLNSMVRILSRLAELNMNTAFISLSNK